MTQLPNGETAEHLEDLSPADMADRVDEDPDEQENRAQVADPHLTDKARGDAEPDR